MELASLYGREGRLLDAMTLLEVEKAAVVAPPWGPKVRRNPRFAFSAPGAADWARNAFLDGVPGGSADALTHLGLAHTRMLEGNTETAIDAFRRGTALDSTLASPFVRAWKSTLRFALTQEDATGALSRLIDRLDAGAIPDTVLHGTTGAEATMPLVGFVLEGWSFKDADLVVEQLEAAEKQIAEEGYDTPPKPINQVAAEYPEFAQDQGMEGEVLVKVSIDDAGAVTDAAVESTNADRRLVESALKAAMKWTFEPAVRYGSPVSSTIVIPFKFKSKK
ncbi:MAG: energy transducer TonB [Candidatus Eisenbacteria bacterium]